MTAAAATVLVLGDTAARADVAARSLRDGGLDAHVHVRTQPAAAVATLAELAPDVIVLDLGPAARAREVVGAMRAAGDGTPVVGIVDEDDAELDPLGAADVVPRSTLAPRPLTRRVQLALRLAARGREHAHLARAREELLAAISHDLRGPLSAINVAVDALADPAVPADERGRYVEAVQRSVRRADRLIHDVGTISLLAAGELALERSPTVLRPLLEQVAREHAEAAARRRRALRVVAAELAPVRADPGRLLEALDKLVANAVAHGAGEIRLTVADVAHEPGWIELVVEDDGPGVAPELAAQLFDPGRPRRRGRGGGPGLGLGIARGIARAHGGDLELRASATGARFVLRLPRSDA
ncbi:MAG: ATP-binding protein [Kofleriaceae bacterium]